MTDEQDTPDVAPEPAAPESETPIDEADPKTNVAALASWSTDAARTVANQQGHVPGFSRVHQVLHEIDEKWTEVRKHLGL